ncbi:MAG TPA: DUF4126 domain-containing protein [Phycisphaerae bacterium]|nr:DUF4126 domain-containing protein [Phycisphaerae bacterium]HUS44973.1 DUF4126 domain-containing protein [Phycisphaerae bacterium]
MNAFEAVLAVMAGIGLSAACGFRVFVPLLVMSVAAHSGHLELAEGFAWIGSLPALIAFSIATALEIAAYYVPWLDNLLDTIATPAAAVAGIIVTAACITDMSPFLRWTLAVMAGGGVALTVQALTVTTRGTSTMKTAGAANPLVSTAEAIGSVGVSLLAILVPVLVGVVLLVLAAVVVRRLFLRRRPAAVVAG